MADLMESRILTKILFHLFVYSWQHISIANKIILATIFWSYIKTVAREISCVTMYVYEKIMVKNVYQRMMMTVHYIIKLELRND